MKQAESLGALHFCYGILPDLNLAMEDKSNGLKRTNEITAEILKSDYAVPLLHEGNIGTVAREKAAGHGDTVHFFCEKEKVFKEFFIASTVAHIAITVGVGIKAGERRGEYTVVDRIVREAANQFATVPIVNGIFVCDMLT